MSRTRTVAEIQSNARMLADQVNSTFVTSAQLDYMTDQSLARLWGKLAEADPTRFEKTTTISASQGTTEYSLPSDFMSVIYVHRLDGTTRFAIKPYGVQETASLQWNGFYERVDDWVNVHYRIKAQGQDGADARIVLWPEPGNETYELGYVQAPPKPNGSGSIDGISGFENWIEHDLAIQMKIKEESDTTALERRLALIERDIESLARKRDAGRPRKIQDVRSPVAGGWPRRYY